MSTHRRLAAGGRQRKRQGLTPEGLQRLREAALKNKPWLHSTGPKTLEGKARASQNGRYRQTNDLSRREIQTKMGKVHALLAEMAASQRAAIGEE